MVWAGGPVPSPRSTLEKLTVLYFLPTNLGCLQANSKVLGDLPITTAFPGGLVHQVGRHEESARKLIGLPFRVFVGRKGLAWIPDVPGPALPDLRTEIRTMQQSMTNLVREREFGSWRVHA